MPSHQDISQEISQQTFHYKVSQSFPSFAPCLPRREQQRRRKGGEAKKKTNRVRNEPEEQPSREEEEGAETQPEQPEQDHEPDPEDEDEDESPALQRIVEFYEAHPYFYNLRHEKYRNTKLKEAELAELAKEIKWTGE